jgi:hypothetical protein
LSNALVALGEELTTIMSSTYTRTNTVTSLLLRKNSDVSPLEGTKPSFSICHSTVNTKLLELVLIHRWPYPICTHDAVKLYSHI